MKAAVTSGWTPGEEVAKTQWVDVESDRLQAGDRDEKKAPEKIPERTHRLKYIHEKSCASKIDLKT